MSKVKEVTFQGQITDSLLEADALGINCAIRQGPLANPLAHAGFPGTVDEINSRLTATARKEAWAQKMTAFVGGSNDDNDQHVWFIPEDGAF